MVTLPFRLSFIVLAIFSAEPSAEKMAFANLLKSVSLALTIANNPDIASVPAMAEAYCVFCVSDNLLNFWRMSCSV